MLIHSVPIHLGPTSSWRNTYAGAHVSRETRIWTVLGLLVAVVSAWIAYQQWQLAATPPGQYVRTAEANEVASGRSPLVSASSESLGERQVDTVVAPPTPALSVTGSRSAAELFSFESILPGKIDIFWCDGLGSDGRRHVAGTILSRLSSRTSSRVRARPLAERINSGPSYSIYDNIVRYDPGEAEVAKELAMFASYATGHSFSAAPALPGSPSIDYVSIFVCR